MKHEIRFNADSGVAVMPGVHRGDLKVIGFDNAYGILVLSESGYAARGKGARSGDYTPAALHVFYFIGSHHDPVTNMTTVSVDGLMGDIHFPVKATPFSAQISDLAREVMINNFGTGSIQHFNQ